MSLTHCARLLVPHSEHLTRLVVWDMSSHEAREVLIDGFTVRVVEGSALFARTFWMHYNPPVSGFSSTSTLGTAASASPWA